MPSQKGFLRSAAAAALIALPALVSAHFQIRFPAERGYKSETISKYPCGGFDTPSKERTDFPISGGPVWIDNEHTSSLIQVVLAVNDDPNGDDFVYTMLPTKSVVGPDNFCVKNVQPPKEANVKEGTKGTIMVISSGHGANSGLYACADVVFTSKNLTSSQMDASCKTSPGVQYFDSKQANANGTEASGSNADSNGSSTGDNEGSAGAFAPSLAAVGSVFAAAVAGAAVFY